MVIGTLGRLAVLSTFVVGSAAKDWLGAEYKDQYLYQYPLPIPKDKTPKKTFAHPVTGSPIDYYEIDIQMLKQQVYPNLGQATLYGYDGVSPGPTFRMERGREAVVRFINNAKLANSVHLHGSYSRAPWDGWAEDTTPVGSYKDYYYPNAQSARTLWYHDHAIDHTAENAYYGQAGFYLLHDKDEDQLGLPSGKYDIPLGLSAKQYNSDGSLYSPANEDKSLFGDVIHVNGQPWPFLRVEPRKYRFRFLNAAISRSFIAYFEKDTAVGTKLPFQVIASDGGLLSGPIASSDLTISMAERWEVVFDFTSYAGQNVTLRNSRKVGADDDYKHTDKIMKFIVGTSVSDPTNNGGLPSSFRTIPWPKDKSTVDHHFRFERSNGEWKINGITFADPNSRVLANVPRGTVEVWELENSSGGWTHPIHIHLIDMKIVKRTGGKRGILPYEAAGLKDVVWLDVGETVTVEAHYAPWDGLYMFHCHNLIHEDHEMMAAFNVTLLQDLNYNETHFLDPMEERWRAKPYKASDWSDDSVLKAKIEAMALLDPYRNVKEAEDALDMYWKTKNTAAATLATRTATGTTLSTLSTITKAATTTSKKDDDAKKTSSSAKTTTTKKK